MRHLYSYTVGARGTIASFFFFSLSQPGSVHPLPGEIDVPEAGGQMLPRQVVTSEAEPRPRVAPLTAKD